MTTGDLTNNLRKLQREVKLIKYESVDIQRLSKGVPAAFLPIYHYAFTMYSPALAEKIAEMDIELFGKSDLKFMEGVYRVLRDMFGYKPPITKDQFFSSSFAERKVIMCTEVLNLIYKKHRSLCPQNNLSSSGFKVNSSLNSSARGGSKVGFQRPKASQWQVERGDSASSGTNVLRKVADHNSSRPSSANSNRPNSARSEVKKKASSRAPSSAGLSNEQSEDDYPNQNIAENFHHGGVPKTPGILKAKSSAVQVVYVPRVANTNSEESLEDRSSQPIDVVAASPAKCEGQGRTVEASPSLDQLTQLQTQTNTVHRAVELITERVGKLEEVTGSQIVRGASDQSDNDSRITTLTANVNNKIETILARLLLVENRVAIIENKIIDGLVPVSGHDKNDEAPKRTEKYPGNLQLDSVSPSPIKPSHNTNIEQNGQVTPEIRKPGSNTKSDDDLDICTDIRSSTPTDKDGRLPYSCIDQATQERAERVQTMLKDTAGILKNIGPLSEELVA